ncbi:MAG: YceI family protein [Arcobacter sp.]|uniref:YceI family protein n=1 Tax=uncultured Arcobacter sp. TaxID=165434 RepID=UPI000CC02A44|nr:YceI family protein [uncultured Arcobacter sp.]PLY10698.1 MAG: YceI family protein [Arcobacter sp.]
MFKLVLVLLFALIVNAQELKLLDGQIQAHTEVFGDSTINPQTKDIIAIVQRGDNIESISGVFSINSSTLVSDNKDRDKNMYELLKSSITPTISFNITSITKVEDKYKITGNLTLNSVTKEISSLSTIKEADGLAMNGDFSFLLTDFGLEPPTMFFLTVRDQIDIKYNFTFVKGM